MLNVILGEEEDEDEEEESRSARSVLEEAKRIRDFSFQVCFRAVLFADLTPEDVFFFSSSSGKERHNCIFVAFSPEIDSQKRIKNIKPCGERRRRRRKYPSSSSSSRSSPRSSSSRTVLSFLLSMVTTRTRTTTATESCFKFHASERQRGTKIAFCILVSKERRGGVTSQRRTTVERWWMTRCCRR